MDIAFIGSQSCGKTTQLKKFMSKYPERGYVTEAARDCPYALNEKTNILSQDWIMREQIKRELANPVFKVTISDRSTLDQLAYVKYAYDHGNMSTAEYKRLEKMLVAWAQCAYELLVYFPIEFPIVLDGLRSNDEEYRKEIDDNIRYVLDTYAHDVPHIEVRGTIEERFKTIDDKINELIAKDETLRY